MVTEVSWILLLVVGGFFMWLITWSENDWLDAFAVRAAGCSFVGAGTVGADGFIGRLVTGTVDWVMSTTNDLSAAALGATVVGIIGALLGAVWLVAMAPSKLFRYNAPDWLLISGFFFPSLLIQVGGVVGDVLRSIIIDFGANGMVGLVSVGF